MKTYSGTQSGAGGQRVQLEEGTRITTLNPRTDLFNHSPDGFQWGYYGSGSAQLALALLADALEDDRRALALHQEFKRQFVGHWGSIWRMTSEEIRAWALEEEEVA